MTIKHNKGKYIRKYDYLRSFYLPEDEWFIPTNVLAETIENLAKIQKKDISADDLQDENSDSIEIDAYSIYKEAKEEGSLTKEDTDPRIIEGNIVDKQAKEFIKKQFNIKAVDLSLDKTLDTYEKAFDETLKYLKEDNIILFQPTFIYGDLITRPDALVIKDGKAILIEVKGTTNPKIAHTFDLYFQFNVINPIIKLSQCMLCLIKYELGKINSVSFVLNERGSFSKSGFNIPKKYKTQNPFDPSSIEAKAQFRQAIHSDLNYAKPIFNFINLFNNPIDDDTISQISRPANGLFLVRDYMNENAFNQQIETLKQYQPNDNTVPSFAPCLQYKSELKDAENWKMIRDFWFNTSNYYATQFSGNLIKFKNAIDLNSKPYESLEDFINKIKTKNDLTNQMKIYLNYLTSEDKRIRQIKDNSNNVIFAYDHVGLSNYYQENLRAKKKVYFDFESINTAIRAVDGTPPFMQAVNQVSVCYDNGDSNLNSIPSLVIDPKNGMTIDDYKKIIDCILPPTSASNLDDMYEYWSQFKYIVYNKSFECTRLNEMSYLINEEQYLKKVKIIVDNIVDLANLFTISKDKKCFVVFKELKGLYSIKKVLPLVMKYDNSAFKKAKCKDYQTLGVKNGSMAQSLSTRRFFGKISDESWIQHTTNLKVYCDNDVRAMAAIEYFIVDILDEKININN